LIVGRDTVEALEDAFEFAGNQTEAGVRDGEHDPGVALDAQAAADVNAARGVLHGVVEEVEDGGAKVFDVAEDEETNAAGDVCEDYLFRPEVVVKDHRSDAVGDERMEFDAGALVDAFALAEFAGLENGFDGGEEAIAVFAHDGIEALPLLLIAGVALEGFEVELDAGDGSFELVGDGFEERVLALVATDFADEEDGVEHDAGDEDREEHDAEEIDGEAAAVVVYPGDVEDDGEDRETHAQRDEERFGSAAACEIHA
jgi:hypothetical protein